MVNFIYEMNHDVITVILLHAQWEWYSVEKVCLLVGLYVWLFVRISQEPHVQTSTKFLYMFFMAMARSSVGAIAILVLWITCFDILNKKHLKNVGPIRHCEPPHAACFTLPFTRCRYCRTPPVHRCPQQHRQQRQLMTGDRYGPMEWAQSWSDY